MRKARVMITLDCPRSCDGCCNNGPVFDEHRVISSFDEIIGYDQIFITGGEPMLMPDQTGQLFYELRQASPESKLYLYTSLYDRRDEDIWHKMLMYVDGIQFTLHAEADWQDVKALKDLSRELGFWRMRSQTHRLSIDARLYDKYDFSNIDMTPWDVVRKLVWLKDCPLPADEELFLLQQTPKG